MNRINITKRVSTVQGKRYCPVVYSANGRIKPHYVIVDGKPEHHPEGSYNIEWREGGKRIRRSVGNDPLTAAAKAARQEQILAAKAAGIKVVEEEKKPLSLDAAMEEFLLEKEVNRKKTTISSYRNAFAVFRESCTKQNLLDIEREDILAFIKHMKKEGYHPRTIHQRFKLIGYFLAHYGIKPMLKGDTPAFTREEPEVYEDADIEALWKACDEDQRLYFEFFLGTGMRRQEVENCTWDDINLQRGTVTVRYKPQYGWSPKAYKGREIPMPRALVEKLKTWKEKQGASNGLVFRTRHGHPITDGYERLHYIVRKAGLNPEKYWLHKFRATFATTHLRNGVDVRTVMEWMGHSDMNATLRYLKPARHDGMREKVDAAFAGLIG
jgi:integrase